MTHSIPIPNLIIKIPDDPVGENLKWRMIVTMGDTMTIVYSAETEYLP